MQYVKENLRSPAEGPECARLKICPYTMNGEKATEEDWAGSRCAADKCMAWRWMPLLATDPKYIAALKECESIDIQENGKLRKMRAGEAAAYVNENRKKFGLPEKPFEGYCGLAGNP